MAGEDDQPIVAQPARAGDALEVVVGDEVGAVAAAPVPAQEAEVEAPELLRQPGGDDPAADVGAGEGVGEVDDMD